MRLSCGRVLKLINKILQKYLGRNLVSGYAVIFKNVNNIFVDKNFNGIHLDWHLFGNLSTNN